MPVGDEVAERLRAFVKERVRPGGRHYKRGTAARLAEHLQTDPGWVTLYTEPDSSPVRRHADIDEVLAICEFFDVDLRDFQAGGPRLSRQGSTVAGSSQGGDSDVPASAQRAHLREIAALKTRITRLEIALRQVRDGARKLGAGAKDIARLTAVADKGRAPTRRRA